MSGETPDLLLAELSALPGRTGVSPVLTHWVIGYSFRSYRYSRIHLPESLNLGLNRKEHGQTSLSMPPAIAKSSK